MSHLKSTITSLIPIILLFTAVNAHADFQNAVGLGIFQVDYNDGDKSDETGLIAAHFFETVDTSKGPLDEAIFMQRTAGIGGSVSREDGNLGTTNYDGNTYGVALTVSRITTPFVFNIAYNQGERDYSGVINYSSDITFYYVSVGYYVEQYTLLTIGHSKYEAKYSGISTAKITSDANDISLKKLFLYDNDTALSLFGSYSKSEDQDGDQAQIYEVGGTYYPDRQLGFGVHMAQFDIDNSSDTKAVGLMASFYINSSFNLSATYYEYMPDDAAERDYNSMSINGSMLF